MREPTLILFIGAMIAVVIAAFIFGGAHAVAIT